MLQIRQNTEGVTFSENAYLCQKKTRMRLIIFTNRDLASNYNLNLLYYWKQDF